MSLFSQETIERTRLSSCSVQSQRVYTPEFHPPIDCQKFCISNQVNFSQEQLPFQSCRTVVCVFFFLFSFNVSMNYKLNLCSIIVDFMIWILDYPSNFWRNKKKFLLLFCQTNFRIILEIKEKRAYYPDIFWDLRAMVETWLKSWNFFSSNNSFLEYFQFHKKKIVWE